MTTSDSFSELSNLISESKRKNAELRTAAEKSLQELKSITVTSEQQLAGDLRSRPAFIEPFLIACAAHNTRFSGSGIACLQRLIVSGGLPRSRLQDALEAFNNCADLGLDVQLKILQALPTLLQNYTNELVGDLLGGALQLCASLQAAREYTVSGVAAATLQQLVTSVFEKVWNEDKASNPDATTTEVPGDDGPLELRPAAFDAYRVFRDLALAADGRQTKFVEFSALPPESSLELIWSSIDSNPELFKEHEELLSIIGANLFPLVVRALSEKLPFSVTVRLFRILDLVLDRYMARFAGDCEVALNLGTQLLETDSAPGWKRALVLEILRDFFDDSTHVIDAYSAFDSREGGKPIVQDVLSAFVRLSTERPAAIGLGQQSTIPTGPTSPGQSATDQATLEAAGGMTGVISSALGVTESSVAGVSSQWSLPKSPCMDQLDKSEPPALPETYPYALLLECLNGLSDSLARVILPLTAVAGIVDSCWPAVLATCSTFLNAALDDHYFRNLIKAYQRFAQVAGLLRLTTPRDALMTTLAKAAVPPHVLNAALVSSGPESAKSPITESPRTFSNPRALLSVDSLVSQASSLSLETSRRPTSDLVRPTLSVRNLLSLRALLNLAIALGPTLASAFAVVVSALKQADMVLSATTPQQLSRQSSFMARNTNTDPPSVVQAFSAEVAAVEAAASRLLESTADYPNDAFVNVLQTFCQLLKGKPEGVSSPISPASPRPSAPSSPPRTPVAGSRRTFSGLPGISTIAEMQLRDYHLVIPKLGNLAELNVPRFTSDDADSSGWNVLVDQLVSIATSSDAPKEARATATNVLVKLAEAVIVDVTQQDPEDRAPMQQRAVAVLLRLDELIYEVPEREISSSDLEVQAQVLGALQTILERCGDSLLAGWHSIVGILASAFEHDGPICRNGDVEHGEVHIKWEAVQFDVVSSHIGRMSFTALQLLCSDFLESVPPSAVENLVEILHRFMCQDEDLNAALTTITMTWNVANYLFGKLSREELVGFCQEARDFEDLAEELKPMLRHSKPALWLLVLLRLRDVASRPSRELRNAAFQTLCNVFKSHGEDLPAEAWDLLLRCTLIHVARVDSYLHLDTEHSNGNSGAERVTPDVELSKNIIMGNTSIIAQHIRLIEQVSKLPSLWEMILSMLERYLDVEDRSLTATVWSSLAKVLQGISADASFWRGPIYRTASLWSKRVPHFSANAGTRKDSNLDALTAYVEAGEEIYRLTKDAMSLSQTRSMIDNLYTCVKESDGPLYGADLNNASPIQSKTLDLFKKMQSEVPNAIPCLVTVASKMSQLYHDMTDGTKSTQGPTFVAISSDATAWLQDLLCSNTEESSEGLLQSLQGLRRIIQAKYAYKLEHKEASLWRKATTTALALVELTLRIESTLEASTSELWGELVGIASGIVNAHGLSTMTDAKQKIYDDQLFDIESFEALRKMLTPCLQGPDLPTEVPLSYVRALFEASIVHQPETGELSDPTMPLKDLGKIRRGRVKKVPCSQREELAYVCWKELVTLAGSVPINPLAEAAKPWLLLRLAIPVRAYIADQPLRGRRPQPLSELEELLFAFETIKDHGLQAPVRASNDIAAGEKALYALLIEAVGTAADPWSGAAEVLTPLQSVLAALATLMASHSAPAALSPARKRLCANAG
ncbi:Protein MON2-like [Pseudocercospora fuligena]|uniref:Protein MON2-like n=1 Tax=Pseudocercospora fuligena TaxID=685502 RepID=A0A8H6RN29_9PEZI|nr:Protein MON2-like [Pseudocercospora fuligena]